MNDFSVLKKLAQDANEQFPALEDQWSMVCTPAVGLELLAEIERLRTAEGDAMTYKAGMENVAQQRDQLKAEVEAFKVANAELSEINVARRNHLSNAKKAAGIGPMDDLVGAIEALRKDARLGRVAIRYIDRLCDPAECDPLETIVEEYVTAFSAAMSKEAAQ